MTMIGAGCTVLVIFIAIQTCNTARKVKRIREYLDIKETREEQEEDDQMWKDKIGQGCTVIRPNPTRNQEQMTNDKKELKELINRAAQDAGTADNNMETLLQHARWLNIRGSTRDQEEEVTIPLL